MGRWRSLLVNPMRTKRISFSFVFLALSLSAAPADFPLTVATGVPLRLYLTKRLTKRRGEMVHAKLLEPLYALDREVVPAGAEVIGRVATLNPVPKMNRAAAILNGDFTPLHGAQVQFTTIVMPDGRRIELSTAETAGLSTIYSPVSSGKTAKPHKRTKNAGQPATGVLGTGKQAIHDQINAQISARTRGVADVVRGPDKIERLEDFLIVKLPWHPQWIRKGTRFDAELLQPVGFGDAHFQPEDLRALGSPPPPDSIVYARLVTPLSSDTATMGEKVEAIVCRPLFSPENKIVLPVGTRLSGAVTLVRGARYFHRGGQLRFNFDKIDLPENLAHAAGREVLTMKTAAALSAAEQAGKTAIKIDSEGGVQATEPKTRLIAPVISVLIAAKSMDNDSERVGTHEGNAGGRALGGASGFGLAGALAAQSSKGLGTALGFYGMGWSVYSNIIARGGEVDFGNNAAIDIRFGSRP